MRMRRRSLTALLLLTLSITGCDVSSLGSIHLTVEDDLSGEVMLVRLEAAAEAVGDLEPATGVEWTGAGRVSTIAGQFADLNQLKLGEVTFEAHQSGAHRALAITLPRGPDVTWPSLITIVHPEDQHAIASLLETSQARRLNRREREQLGHTVKIQLSLPAPPISSALSSHTSGVKASMKKLAHEASLVVPVDVAAATGPPLIWKIQW